ncbi:MAG TPA: ABC transporter ATP-binding protein [Pirellulaceae bacterium]|nr:ABC transporter ATP-binding protein [Pirellulaceae bacterium]
MIQIEHVTRKYGAKVAVSDLNLEIPAGELFACLGPNGAGKTTTIKMMVGLLQPTAGRIQLCGVDAVTQRREANRLLGFVPDQPYLYEKLSGREFLQFVADLFGLGAQASRDGIEEQIAALELAPFVDHLTESYSHGMKQRLAFAAAFLHKPQLLILDEPMVGLDPRSMRMVKDLLRKEARRGTTVFMSTHTLSIAEEIADRIGVIDHGRLLFLGTVSELRTHLSLGDESLEQLYLTLTEPVADDIVPAT